MTNLALFVGGVLIVLVGLMIAMQSVIRARAKALEGKVLPDLPGSLGQKIARARKGLVYFFSPGCAACRSITPRIRELSRKNASVFLVDVSQDFSIARALSVMATPSTIEVAEGRVVAYHVGVLPPDLLSRFR